MKVIMLGHTSERGSQVLILEADHACHNSLDFTQAIHQRIQFTAEDIIMFCLVGWTYPYRTSL